MREKVKSKELTGSFPSSSKVHEEASWFAKPVVETSVLSLSLKSMSTFIEVASKIDVEDFLSEDNRTIYVVMLNLSALGVAEFDLPSVASSCQDLGVLDKIGGYQYLDALFAAEISPLNLDVYVKQMLDASLMFKLRKSLVVGAEDVYNVVNNQNVSANEILSNVENKILSLSLETLKVEDGKQVATGLVERLKDFESNPSQIRGLRSGFPILDRITNGFKPGGLYVLAARAKTGKCLSGDTLLLDTNTGLLKRIDDFNGSVASLDKGKIMSCGAIGPVCSGEKDVFIVSTRMGKSIKVTKEHPFLTATGWGSISDKVVVGSHVAVPSKIPFFGAEAYDKNKLTLAAYWLSEGNPSGAFISSTTEDVLVDAEIAISNLGFISKRRDKGIVVLYGDDYYNDLSKKFDIQSKIKKYLFCNNVTLPEFAVMSGIKYTTIYNIMLDGHIPAEGVCDKLIRFDNNILGIDEEILSIRSNNKLLNPLRHILDEMGIKLSQAYYKEIPSKIFSLGKEYIAHFLNRLFSGDGWICESEIGYSSCSEKMIDSVIHLLLRFGIVAKKRSRRCWYSKNGERVYTAVNYTLSIFKKSYMKIFLTEIGCVGRKKEVDSVLDILFSRKDGDVFGHPPKELLGLVLKDKTHKDVLGFRRSTGRILKVGSRGVSLEILQEICDYFSLDKENPLVSTDVFWDEVVSIEPAGKSLVYDIEVLNDSHNFVANDVIVHNSVVLGGCASYITLHEKKPVLYIDTEMSTNEFQTRLLSHISKVPERIIINGLYANDAKQLEAVYYGLEIMKKMNLFHKYMPGFRMDEVKSVVRKYKAKEGIEALFFDYIKMVEMGENFNETQTIGNITSSLKDLAGILNIPCITACQLGRSSHEKSKVGSDEVADSDRILRYCNLLMALTRKDKKEIDQFGIAAGTHRLQILENRSGSTLYNGIDLVFKAPILTMEEATTQSADSFLEQRKTQEDEKVQQRNDLGL
jgi:replicative DNA helicase